MRHKDSDGVEGGGAAQPVADLNLLRTFLAVHRSGSFTAAAGLLGLSQPTVTTQIRALERQTGRELFQRLPRGVAPTPVAHDLAARVAGPLDALAAVTGHEAAPASGRLPSTWRARRSCSARASCPRSPR
ncbi:LysR family transcriptional regulator [Streptomyces tanashiensis]